jgi:hypothetical protein
VTEICRTKLERLTITTFFLQMGNRTVDISQGVFTTDYIQKILYFKMRAPKIILSIKELKLMTLCFQLIFNGYFGRISSSIWQTLSVYI